jgi:4-hydroxybenzoyl-CoA reductase subunit beta
MLRLPVFEYLAPRTVDEAVGMMGERGPGAMYVAGGTDLYPNMKRRQFEPETLIGLRRIESLRHVDGDAKQGITLGASVTLTQVSRHPEIAGAYPALAESASLVSTPQLRNMGTIGGNLCVDTRCNYYNQTYFWRKAIGFCMKKDGDICLVAPGSAKCWAVSSSDTAPVMIALGAEVVLAGPEGERVIPAQALYQDDGMAYLTKSPGEILTEIRLPPTNGLKMTYLKLRRRDSFDFPILSVACGLDMAEDGTVNDARIVLGSVHTHPLEATVSQEMLVGEKLTEDLIVAAAGAAYKPAKPLDNTDMALSYRKKMVRVYVARALREVGGLSAN